MPSVLQLKKSAEDKDALFTFELSSFEFGVFNTLGNTMKNKNVVVAKQNNVSRTQSWEKFTFIHDLDDNAVRLEKCLNQTFFVKLVMKEVEQVGNVCYINLELTAKVSGLVTKPIELFADSLTHSGYSNKKMGQIVTMEIIAGRGVSFTADKPVESDGRLVRRGSNSVTLI